MTPPLAIRHFTDEARAAREAGRRRHDACRGRRCQMVCARAGGQKPATLATTWHGAPQPGRHVIHACAARGLACVPRGAHGPRRVEPVLNAATREPVPALLHHSPRHGGNPARVWTRPWLAEAGHAPGLSTTPRAWPTRREASIRLGVHGPCAPPGMVRPDPADAFTTSHALG